MTFRTTQIFGLVMVGMGYLLSSVPFAAAQVGTIALHYGYNCQGNYIGCQNMPSGRCCSIDQQFSPGPSSVAVWAQGGGYMFADGRATGYGAFSDTSCLGRLHQESPGRCITGRGAYWSGIWWQNNGRMGATPEENEAETNITTSLLESKQKSTEDCATADVYGFIEGDEVTTFPIPQGSEEAKAALYELLAQENTDGAALRKFAEVNTAAAFNLVVLACVLGLAISCKPLDNLL